MEAYSVMSEIISRLYATLGLLWLAVAGLTTFYIWHEASK